MQPGLQNTGFRITDPQYTDLDWGVVWVSDFQESSQLQCFETVHKLILATLLSICLSEPHEDQQSSVGGGRCEGTGSAGPRGRCTWRAAAILEDKSLCLEGVGRRYAKPHLL